MQRLFISCWMCLSTRLIIGVFHCSLFFVAKTTSCRGQNHSQSLLACQKPQHRHPSSFFLGNPGPGIAWQEGHFRSKAGIPGELRPEFLIDEARIFFFFADFWIWNCTVTSAANAECSFHIKPKNMKCVYSDIWYESMRIASPKLLYVQKKPSSRHIWCSYLVFAFTLIVSATAATGALLFMFFDLQLSFTISVRHSNAHHVTETLWWEIQMPALVPTVLNDIEWTQISAKETYTVFNSCVPHKPHPSDRLYRSHCAMGVM